MTPKAGFAQVWHVAKGNGKTGAILTSSVGVTYDETVASCRGCPQSPEAGGGCYAHLGKMRAAFQYGMLPAFERNPFRYTLTAALAEAFKGIRPTIARIGAIGDPSRADRSVLLSELEFLTREGIRPIGYTHFSHLRENAELRGWLMASVEGGSGADKAIARGWVPAAIVPETVTSEEYITPAGNRLRVCEATPQRGKLTDCSRCGLCSPSHPYWQTEGAAQGIAFPGHGIAVARAMKKLPMVDRAAV